MERDELSIEQNGDSVTSVGLNVDCRGEVDPFPFRGGHLYLLRLIPSSFLLG